MSENAPSLYLAAEAAGDVKTFAQKLEAALGAGGAASLLLRLGAADAALAEPFIRAAIDAAQPRGVAVVIDGAPGLVPLVGADGAHVAGCGSELLDAVKKLSPKYIVGAGGLSNRDDAMRAGEAGVDYVLFGDVEGDSAQADPDGLRERVSWWAEIFNTPCVALARRLDDIEPLTAVGADFIMVDDCVWSDPRGPGAAMVDAKARLARALAEGSGE